MTADQNSALTAYLNSLDGVSWFSHCGEPDTDLVVAEDLVDAWDNWNAERLAAWLPQSRALERTAVSALGEDDVDAIFAAVSRFLYKPLLEGINAYFERWPYDLTNTDRALWREWLTSAMRDLSWAGVEAVLGQRGFFTLILWFYREGRWPCAWHGDDRSGCLVVL